MPNSSKAWAHRHVSDHYVQKAKNAGLRSRAAFKLSELIEKGFVLIPNSIIVDLGSAPGSWSQWLSHSIKPPGLIIATDILMMKPVAGVEFVLGDFTSDVTLKAINEKLDGKTVDLVVSDMAPNISGIRDMDRARMENLIELALDFAVNHLKKDGSMLVKVFQSPELKRYNTELKKHFTLVKACKPSASRPESSEFYYFAKGFKGAIATN